jgi:energy-coupling factor transport system permease protein
MQDIRLRIAAGLVLTLSAFFSLVGAALAFLWWIACSGKVSEIIRMRMILPVAGMLAFFSAVLSLSGGDGVSYFLRMMVIVLVGSWIYAEQKSGEFLHLGVWLLGNRIGFELGMLADMAMQTLDLMVRDFDTIRVAQSLKGAGPAWKTLVPGGLVLVTGALSRAEHTAELMAVRGYRCGGSLCPRFFPARGDSIRCLTALCILIITVIPVSEFFILYR